MILDKINDINDIKKISPDEYDELASEIREFLVNSISKTGGHLASNLGVVELTMALHLALNLPEDKIIFDVGHQSYTHKILTGRKEDFNDLRTYGGMSGFPKKRESECDSFETGHSSTSISAGLGIVTANAIEGKKGTVVSIIGDGADRNEIENKIKGFNLENNVNLLGNQSDVSRFLDDTKVYVHSATNEGFGISVVEAMYMKCPCILADASALPELIDESCGYLISPERPDIWAEKLIFLVDNPLVRLKMGEAAHKRVQEKFSFDSYVNNIDKLYDELIENAHHQ